MIPQCVDHSGCGNETQMIVEAFLLKTTVLCGSDPSISRRCHLDLEGWVGRAAVSPHWGQLEEVWRGRRAQMHGLFLLRLQWREGGVCQSHGTQSGALPLPCPHRTMHLFLAVAPELCPLYQNH